MQATLQPDLLLLSKRQQRYVQTQTSQAARLRCAIFINIQLTKNMIVSTASLHTDVKAAAPLLFFVNDIFITTKRSRGAASKKICLALPQIEFVRQKLRCRIYD